MPKMVKEIKTDIKETWGNSPAVAICMRLLDFIEQSSPDEVQMLSMRRLQSISSANEKIDDFRKALTILTSGREKVLETRFLFIDDDDQEKEVPAEEVFEAEREGWLVNPFNGERIFDYRHRLFTFFSVSRDLYKISRNAD